MEGWKDGREGSRAGNLPVQLERKRRSEGASAGERRKAKGYASRITHHASRITHYALFITLLWSVSAQSSTFLAPLGETDRVQGSRVTGAERKTNPLTLPHFVEIRLDRGNRVLRSPDDFRGLASERDLRLLQKRSISDFISLGEEGNHLLPNISPDGTRLSFVAQTTREIKMYLIDFSTGQVSQIRASQRTPDRSSGRRRSVIGRRTRRGTTDEGGVAADFAWSHSGRYYAFTSEGKVYLGMPQVPEPYLLTDEKAYVAFPRWSPDDEQLLYASGKTGNGDLYRIATLGEFLRELKTDRTIDPKLTPSQLQPQQLTGIVFAEEKRREEDVATWLSEKKIIYQSYRDGTTGFDLLRFEVNQRTASHLHENISLGDQMYPRISPDRQKIGFYTNRFQDRNGNPNQQLDKFALFVELSPDKVTMENQLTCDAVIVDTYKGPLWSPDSEYLIYIADRIDQNYPIIARPYKGGTKEPLTGSATEINCTTVDIANQTGKLIVFAAQEGTFQKLFVGVVNFPTAK